MEKEKKKDSRYCHVCGLELKDSDFFYRHRSSINFYLCSNCGFYGLYEVE